MRPAALFLLGVSCFIVLAVSPSAQQPPRSTAAYDTRCASCHGPALTGASGPSVLAYMRYHTDAEATADIRQKHPALAIHLRIRA